MSKIKFCYSLSQVYCQKLPRKVGLPIQRSQPPYIGIPCSSTQVRMLSSCSREALLEEYHPPEWASSLTKIPKHRIKLSCTNTPIHRWNIPDLPDGFQVSIKRDDMTGSTLSGNKVRKLEFLMADAVAKGCSHVMTAGGIQSNHCRSVAIAARQIGLKPHLFLRCDAKSASDIGSHGNLLLDRMVESSLYILPKASPYVTECLPRMVQLAKHIKSTSNKESYIIPVGGSNEVGIFGYIEVFKEMMSQGLLESYDDVVCACGSGTTLSGLAVANYLTGSKLRIHGITVCDNKEYFHNDNNQIFPLIGLKSVQSKDMVHIIDGYKGKGYAISSDEELEFIRNVSKTTGIILDPVYTGKAAFGLHQLLHKSPELFQGKRILFIHTGGVFGLADGRMDNLLKQTDTSLIKMWPNIDKLPD